MFGPVPVARPIEAVLGHFAHSTMGREKTPPKIVPAKNLFSKDQSDAETSSAFLT